MTTLFSLVGNIAVFWLLFAVIWSILVPAYRLWPLTKFTSVRKFAVWVPYITLFVCVFGLGALDWRHYDWPGYVRWGLGLPLFIFGHIIAYWGAFRLGFRRVSGGKGRLKTNGFYQYSRNPQYVANITIMTGWIMLSASKDTSLLALATIVLLILTPFSEEPWLLENYGQEYENYLKSTPRFF